MPTSAGKDGSKLFLLNFPRIMKLLWWLILCFTLLVGLIKWADAS
jgi:hypothetical protein